MFANFRPNLPPCFRLPPAFCEFSAFCPDFGRRAERSGEEFSAESLRLTTENTSPERVWFCAYFWGGAWGRKVYRPHGCPAYKLIAPSLHRLVSSCSVRGSGGGGQLRLCFATRSARWLRKPPLLRFAVAYSGRSLSLPPLPAPPPPSLSSSALSSNKFLRKICKKSPKNDRYKRLFFEKKMQRSLTWQGFQCFRL